MHIRSLGLSSPSECTFSNVPTLQQKRKSTLEHHHLWHTVFTAETFSERIISKADRLCSSTRSRFSSNHPNIASWRLFIFISSRLFRSSAMLAFHALFKSMHRCISAASSSADVTTWSTVDVACSSFFSS